MIIKFAKKELRTGFNLLNNSERRQACLWQAAAFYLYRNSVSQTIPKTLKCSSLVIRLSPGKACRKKKSYYLVKQWLEQEVFGASRKVNLKVKAHSGARIYLHDDELNNLLEAGDDINKFYNREINLSFPSIEAQIDAARKEYESAESVNLILLSGGITDFRVANLINPFFKEEKLRASVHKYCNEAMQRLLEQATETFPNASVAFSAISR